MGAEEVNAFLTSLAVEGNVSASTQNQALSALLFLYKKFRQFWGCFMGEGRRLRRAGDCGVA